ncbi:DUF6274 family protein [Streptomyces sp. NPDC002055]|uniref:DUF6274 family protein n=1 Tax=Streptomyces sp. NPDC002055 TaxID=3154534 RepID=UPI003323DA01
MRTPVRHETKALLRAHLAAASGYRHLTRHCPICHRLLRLAMEPAERSADTGSPPASRDREGPGGMPDTEPTESRRSPDRTAGPESMPVPSETPAESGPSGTGAESGTSDAPAGTGPHDGTAAASGTTPDTATAQTSQDAASRPRRNSRADQGPEAAPTPQNAACGRIAPQGAPGCDESGSTPTA